MIKLDSNIPRPPKRGLSGEIKAVLKKAKVGQSFSIDSYSAMCACYTAAKELGVKIQGKRISKNGTDGYRVWRIK